MLNFEHLTILCSAILLCICLVQGHRIRVLQEDVGWLKAGSARREKQLWDIKGELQQQKEDGKALADQVEELAQRKEENEQAELNLLKSMQNVFDYDMDTARKAVKHHGEAE